MSSDLRLGDCLEIMKSISSNSIESLITDPPAGISFMGKEWDNDKGGKDQWINWLSEVMKECHRVLKPGGHGLVWAIPRTSHWTGMALENASFEVRDIVTHLFGQGFPKCQVFKNDKHKELIEKGFEGWGIGGLKPAVEFWYLIRKPISEKNVALNVLKHRTGAININKCRIKTNSLPKICTNNNLKNNSYGSDNSSKERDTIYNPNELGRFPANLILSHHPDCSLIGMKEVKTSTLLTTHKLKESENKAMSGKNYERNPKSDFGKGGKETIENWQCHPECAVRMLDEQMGELKDPWGKNSRNTSNGENSIFKIGNNCENEKFKDGINASRFFYCAKASTSERNKGLENLPDKEIHGHYAQDEWSRKNMGNCPDVKRLPVKNNHPTVKPIKLMKYLITMVTPPNGIVLDPFMGSGSTGLACKELGFDFIGIEKEKEYFEIAKARINNENL